MEYQLKNYHTHTSRCLHAQNTDEEYVLSAIHSGLQTLGFADHTPWPYPNDFVSTMRMPVAQLPDYVRSIRALAEKYSGEIKIYLGLECEYFPEFIPWLKKVRSEYALDYLLFGNHLSDIKEVGCFFMHSHTPEELRRYTEISLEAIESSLFDCFAHPDVVLSNYPAFDGTCEKICYALCRAALEKGLPLEYNLQGDYYRRIGKTQGIGYPCEAFWQIAGSLGNCAIVGMDAHNAGMLTWTDELAQAQQHLEQLGLRVLDTLPGLD